MESSVLRLARKPIENVRVGFIGLGMRGPGAVERFISLEHATVAALCDLYPGPVADSQKILAGAVGMSVEDVICAEHVFNGAMKAGAGKILDFQCL